MKKSGSFKGKKTIGSGKAFILGRRRFAKISEVEGITLSGAMRKRVADFDRRGASAEERRTIIIRAYRQK